MRILTLDGSKFLITCSVLEWMVLFTSLSHLSCNCVVKVCSRKWSFWLRFKNFLHVFHVLISSFLVLPEIQQRLEVYEESFLRSGCQRKIIIFIKFLPQTAHFCGRLSHANPLDIHLFHARSWNNIVTDTLTMLALRPNYKVTISHPFVFNQLRAGTAVGCANMHTLSDFYSLNDCCVW